MSDCRFDMRRVDVPLTPDETQSFQYACERCGEWHWVIPELEADGTSPDGPAARFDIEAALERFYQNAYGLSWRGENAAGRAQFYEVPEWRPLPAGKETEA